MSNLPVIDSDDSVDSVASWYRNSNHSQTYYGNNIFNNRDGYIPCKNALLAFIKSLNEMMPSYEKKWKLYGFRNWDHFKGVIENDIAIASRVLMDASP